MRLYYGKQICLIKTEDSPMAVGDRFKRIRNVRGLTQKELGLAIRFDDNTADVRVATV